MPGYNADEFDVGYPRRNIISDLNRKHPGMAYDPFGYKYGGGAMLPPGRYLSEHGAEYIVRNGEVETRWTRGSMEQSFKFNPPLELGEKKKPMAKINSTTVEFNYNNTRNGVQGMTLNDLASMIKQLRDYVDDPDATVTDILITKANDGDKGTVTVKIERPRRVIDNDDA